MPSRLLARAQLSASADSSRRETDPLCELLPEMPEGLRCHPAGRLDAGRLEALNEDIAAALGRNTKILFLDFSRIDDISSAGAGFLVALQKRMRAGAAILYCTACVRSSSAFWKHWVSRIFSPRPWTCDMRWSIFRE
ncbi:MAG: STAS domain-containing protein [Candidatus Hydrogenedentales bacterium]